MTVATLNPIEVPRQQTGGDHLFPTVLDASALGENWANKLASQRDSVLKLTALSGAALLRGLPLSGPEDFDRCVRAFSLPNFTYTESLSNAVRRNYTERVFTANEAPEDVAIYLHHEMAQTPLFPSMLLFFCEQPALSGGSTPLCRSDWVFEALQDELPKFAADCEQKGVRYSNTMPAEDDPGSGQGRSWRSTLGVNSRADAEVRLANLGYSWEWQDRNELRVTTPRLHAVRALSDGRKVFFNQLIAAYRGWKDSRNEPEKSIRFGDGSPIPRSAMATAIDIADRLSFDLEWHAGDVALVDNFLVMHGRRPFNGKRRVYASLVGGPGS
ncbi:MAG: TauD/TfdA family dioxygenase [Myxococcota bacterium]